MPPATSTGSAASSSPRPSTPRCSSWSRSSLRPWPTPAFNAELAALLADYTGRPSPVTEAKRFAAHAAGAPTIVLKREDLNHTGSHKINNVLGQALLTRRMGKTRVIAETGAGSTGWPRRPRPRCSGWSAPSTWARWTPSGRRSTWPGCGCSARK
jgi:tryptophan synthase beta chain